MSAQCEGALTGNAMLFVISPSGSIVRKVTIANSSPHMLGLAFNPVTGALWAAERAAAGPHQGTASRPGDLYADAHLSGGVRSR